MSRVVYTLVSGLALGCALTTAAAADILVLYTNVPGLARGARLADEATLNVPVGKIVRFLRPAGGTQEIVGPTRVRVGAITAGERMNEPAWREALSEFTNPKQRNPPGAVGGTRGVKQ